MSIIVVGGTSYLGAFLLRHAARRGPAWGTTSRSIEGLRTLDLNRPDSFDYGLVQSGDTVWLAAANSSPDLCARDHERAWSLNVTGTSRFIERATERGARVVFFSSDTVYGGRTEPFGETAPLDPAGEYAEMKAAVERAFSGHGGFKSIRLSYVFSREDKFTRYLRGCAERGEAAEVFDPFVRPVVHRDDVADGLLALTQHWDELPSQAVNFGGPACVSRVAFADILQRIALPSLVYAVVEPDAAFFVARPRVIAMTSDHLARLLRRPLRGLEDAAALEFGTKESIA